MEPSGTIFDRIKKGEKLFIDARLGYFIYLATDSFFFFFFFFFLPMENRYRLIRSNILFVRIIEKRINKCIL